LFQKDLDSQHLSPFDIDPEYILLA